MTEQPRYPQITVELSPGMDGRAILAAVIVALCEAGVDTAEVQEFRREAIAGPGSPTGDHDHLLATCRAWVIVTGRRSTRPAR